MASTPGRYINENKASMLNASVSSNEALYRNPLDFQVNCEMRDSSGSTKKDGVAGMDAMMSDRYQCTNRHNGNTQQCFVNPDGLDVMAVVSDLYSSTVKTTALISELNEKPQIGYGSTSDDFTDKSKYPWFSRIVSPDRLQAEYLVKLIHHIGWRHVGVVNSDDAYGANFAVQFSTATANTSLIDPVIKIESRQSFSAGASVEDIAVAMRSIRSSGVKVILLAVSSDGDTRNALVAARNEGVAGPGYTWLGPDGWMSIEQFVGPANNNSEVNLRQIARGAIGIFPQFNDGRSGDGDARTAYRNIIENPLWDPTRMGSTAPNNDNTGRESGYASFCQNSQAHMRCDLSSAAQPPLTAWAYYVWDATIFTAQALAKGYGFCGPNQLSSTDRTPRTWNYTCLQSRIREHKMFSSATGDIQLDSVGDRRGAYQILNVNNQDDDEMVLKSLGFINETGIHNFSLQNIIWSDDSSGRTEPLSDGDFSVSSENTDVGAIVGSLVAVFIVIGYASFFVYRRKMKKKLLNVRSTLAKLGNFRQVIGSFAVDYTIDDPDDAEELVHVTENVGTGKSDTDTEFGIMQFDYTPTGAPGADTAIPVAKGVKVQILSSEVNGTGWAYVQRPDGVEGFVPSAYVSTNTSSSSSKVSASSTDSAKWYWEESPANLKRHDPYTVMGQFVPYSAEFSRTLEKAFQNYQKTAQGFTLDFEPVPNSKYTIDLKAMTQIKQSTGFTRPITRVVTDGAPAIPSATVPSAKKIRVKTRRKNPAKYKALQGKLSLAKYGLPGDLIEQGDVVLPLVEGLLLEVTKSDRKDGWLYGTAQFFDQKITDVPSRQKLGASIVNHSGWFPSAATEPATTELQLAFKESLGDYQESELTPPDTWVDVDKMSDVVVRYPVSLDSPEVQPLQKIFNSSMNGTKMPGCYPVYGRIVKIERIQNLALWQSFAVKRIQIKKRDDEGSNPGKYPLWRDITFHGTTEDIADKIMQQGFNRSFCGRNMCRYGKGVYFARDAAYSAQPQYATPGRDGLCRMLVCRVLHGVYCTGKENALTPDVLDQATNRLFDSTVNNVRDPIMWITYHDSQGLFATVLPF